jgi:spectinomycin phosphotransferase
VRTPPEDVDVAQVANVLASGWGFPDAALRYAPVGFGSHHWTATAADGQQRFVTVDVLDEHGPGGRDGAVVRLDAALRTAHALRNDAHQSYVVAPLPAADGAAAGSMVHRLGPGHAMSVFPFVTGRTHPEHAESTPSDRAAVVELLARLHTATPVARAFAAADDLMLAGRAELEQALDSLRVPWRTGPFGEGTRDLLATHAAEVGVLLETYDRWALTRTRGQPWVITHGEPKADNLLVTDTGPVLVDWDTALIAPAARDLWMIESGSGAELELYTELTGRTVGRDELSLYRLRWDLADIAAFVRDFRAPHARTADNEIGWQALQEALRLDER